MSVFSKQIFLRHSSKKEVSFDGTQQKVFDAGLKLIEATDKEYSEHVQLFGKKPSGRGRFSARIFAVIFPISAMTLALCEQEHSRSESVYLQLIEVCKKSLSFSSSEQIKIAKSILREGSRALISEKNNVGSGQYALAAIYESALTISTGPVQPAAGRFHSPLSSLMGQTVGSKLAVWAELYQELANQPMQVYTEGFTRTQKDQNPLDF